MTFILQETFRSVTNFSQFLYFFIEKNSKYLSSFFKEKNVIYLHSFDHLYLDIEIRKIVDQGTGSGGLNNEPIMFHFVPSSSILEIFQHIQHSPINFNYPLEYNDGNMNQINPTQPWSH